MRTGVGVDAMTPIAFVLFMRSMINFSFVGTSPDVEQERQFLQTVQKRISEMAAASLARRLEALPFRERLWSGARTRWEELCRGALSDESVHRWLMAGPGHW